MPKMPNDVRKDKPFEENFHFPIDLHLPTFIIREIPEVLFEKSLR